jgi:dolichol kinase
MLILTILTVFTLLVLSEMWWRLKKPHDELSRKFIHITVGSFAAFWPYFLSWEEILLLSVAFVVVVSISLYFGIFKAIHAVERPTWGEVCFAASVGILALITHEPMIYTVALLHMSLADGLAAIIGTTWGKNSRYTILGHHKSVVGSATFFVVSMVVLLVYGVVAPVMISPLVIVGLAAATTLLENIAVRGLDNLFVPLLVASVLILAG